MFTSISIKLSFLLQKLKRIKHRKSLIQFLKVEKYVIDQLPIVTGLNKGSLIIKCDDLGDFMMWQHVLPEIKKHAERPITFVGNIAVKPLIESMFNFADKYVWIDKTKWGDKDYRLELYKNISLVSANVAWTPLFTRNYKMDDLLLYASRAPSRKAWHNKHHDYYPNIEIAEHFCTSTIDSDQKYLLEYFRNIEFVNGLFQITKQFIFTPTFPDFIKQNRLVIFPVANTESRCWHPENFIKVIKAVKPLFESIVLLGGQNAIDACKQIENEIKDPILLNLCAQTHVDDIIPLIGESSVLLCPDTFALHVAMHTCTDTVLLSNGTNWQRFTDYQDYIKSKLFVLYPKYFNKNKQYLKTFYSRTEINTIQSDKVIEAVHQIKQSSPGVGLSI